VSNGVGVVLEIDGGVDAHGLTVEVSLQQGTTVVQMKRSTPAVE
jgi:hypothetical protein